MKKQQLFQFAILWHPTEEQAKASNLPDIKKKSQILVKLETLLATDQNTAFIQAARSIPEIYLDELDQVEVIIRPF